MYKPVAQLHVLNISENNFPSNLSFLCPLSCTHIHPMYSKTEGKEVSAGSIENTIYCPHHYHASAHTYGTKCIMHKYLREQLQSIFFLFLLFLNSFGGPIFFHFEFWKTLDHKEPGMVNVKCMAPYGNPTLLDTKVHCCSHSLCAY